jgi:glycosyltransferase involved in cell wall biosynthesis
MPFKNAEDTVAAAIDSMNLPDLDEAEYEVVLVNDAANQATEKIINEYLKANKNIKHVRTAGVGVTRALIYGIQHCSGDFIIRMDADDVCVNDRIKKQIEISKRIDVDVLFSRCNLSDPDGEIICEKKTYRSWFSYLLLPYANPYVHPTACFKKSSYDLAGGYNPSLRYGQDWDLWKKLKDINAKFVVHPEVLLHYRLSNNSVSSQHFLEPKFSASGKAKIAIQNNQKIRSLKYFSDEMLHEKIIHIIYLFRPYYLMLLLRIIYRQIFPRSYK